VTRDATANERQDAVEIPLVQRAHAWHPRHAELQDRQSATPAKHASHLGAAHFRVLNVPNPETNRDSVC
jgi:hypothetical protein